MKLNIKNMKSTGLFGAFCCTIMFFASCSSEQITDDNGNNIQTEGGLKLNISKSVFLDTETTESRVTNEGLNTTFSEGDVIGVLVNHKGEKLNLPYKYENGTWTFDLSKGKEFFIKTQAGSLDYVIYYPYSAAADGKTTKDELLEAMPIKEDQSTEENYLASDVLYSEVSVEGTTVEAQLKHARALFSYVISKAKWQTTLSDEIELDLPELDIQFFDNNDKELKMYKTSQGEYRYIVPAGSQGNSISWIYNYKEKLYGDVKDLSQAQENNKYSRIESVDLGIYDESKAKVGDFYCASSENKGYLLPKEYDIAASSHKCIGIVFHIGAGNGDNQSDYSGTDIYTNGIKGYVVALNDAGNTGWATTEEHALNAITDSDEHKWNGFSNTNIIKNKGTDNYPAFKLCTEFVTDSGDDNSGWYLPSIAQLGKVRDNVNIIRNSFYAIQGAGCIDDTTSSYYWSSTQKNGENKQAVFLWGPYYSAWDKIYGAKVRPVLTF